jgi:hypothetical protein
MSEISYLSILHHSVKIFKKVSHVIPLMLEYGMLHNRYETDIVNQSIYNYELIHKEPP